MNQDEQHLRAYEQEVGEMDFLTLITKLYEHAPMEPFSLRLEAMQQLTPQELQGLLGQMLMTGANKLFQKQLHQLTDEELNNIRKYFYVIGFDFDKKLNTITKEVTDYNENGTPFQRNVSLNNWQFSFKSANLELHPNNVNGKLSELNRTRGY